MRNKKHPCDRCGKQVTLTFALPVPEAWGKSLCRNCVFRVRTERDGRIMEELERRAYEKDETWSLYSMRLFDVYPFDAKEYESAKQLVDGVTIMNAALEVMN